MDEKNWQQPEEIIEPVQAENPEQETAEQAEPEKKEKETWQKTVLTYLHDLVYLIAGLVLVFLLLFRVVVVDGDSMNKTLVDGDYLLLLNNVFYHDPEPGDVIVAKTEKIISSDGKCHPIVKRVIATEGQWVDIRDGKVYVGNTKEEAETSTEPLTENYTWADTDAKTHLEYPLLVEDGCLFVLGDNRGNSTDSRNVGLLEKREVLGKVIFLFLPGDDDGTVERNYGRIGEVK